MSPCEELLEYLLNIAQIYRSTSTHRLIFDSILSDPHLIRSIFPVLQPLSQTIAFRLLLLTKGVQESVLAHWLTDGVSAQVKAALLSRSLEELTLLGLIEDRNRVFTISPVPRSALSALLFRPPPPPPPRRVSAAEQDERDDAVFEEIWSEILRKSLDGDRAMTSRGEAGAAVERLLFGEQLRFGRESPESFRFVLSPRRAQIWRLVLEQLKVVETQRGTGELVRALGLLGRVLQWTVADGWESEFGHFLRAIGVLDECGRATVGVAVMRGEDMSTGAPKKKRSLMTGALITTDSNFHITAYTTNALQLRIIGLFADFRRNLGSATAAIITRSSVWRASEAGVSAEKIVEFLQSSASVVPENVVTQLKLWEQDAISVRLKFTDAVFLMYDRITTDAATKEYLGIKDYAAATGCLLGCKETPDKRCLVLHKLKALELGIVPQHLL